MPDFSDIEETGLPVITTGQADLDAKLGGGIPVGSLTLLDGQSDSGKSVVSQQTAGLQLPEPLRNGDRAEAHRRPLRRGDRRLGMAECPSGEPERHE